jgi:tetratricopeptide (TPR) repeat protein
MSFFAELKRRRVFRVAGAYIVGAWIVLQVADTLFPALHLPPWTVTLVAAAVILGFPIALLLGWAFDITPGGVERTSANGTPMKFPVRAAMVGTMLVAVGVASFVFVRRRAVASKLDANAVVVLPFRIAGDASLAVMREGMVDLLSAKLTGEGGPRAIDSRTTMSAWRKKVGNEKDDMPAADAVHLARSLGAGQVLLGEVLGTGGQVVINARLLSALDGTTIVKADDKAPEDSMLQMVDRVVAKLLTEGAGQGHRTEALLSESLSAVQAYLEGQRLYRRGDHATAAMKFKAALDEDSTFALAGLGLALARSWSGYGPDFNRGREVAWTYRERLPLPDREYVVAWLGEKYPEPSAPIERIRAWQRIVQDAPDRVEAWYALGDMYYHFGAIANAENPDDKALEAWRKALEGDSTFVPAISHQIPVYAGRGDTANVRKVAELLFQRIQPEMKNRSSVSWLAALSLGDEEWLEQLRQSADTLSGSVIFNSFLEIVLAGLPQTDVPRLIDIMSQKAANPGQIQSGLINASSALFNMGRPKAALEVLERAKQGPNPDVYNGLILAFSGTYLDVDSAITARAEAALGEGKDPHDTCVISETRLMRGDPSLARKSLPKLRASVVEKPENAPRVGVCTYSLDAGLKIFDKAPDARAALARFDSVLLNVHVSQTWREHFAQASTQYHQQLGDLEGALAASKRVQRDQGFARAPLLLEGARLAARLGKRDEAIESYKMYLKIRANPEPGRASEITAQARSELAALVGEPNNR